MEESTNSRAPSSHLPSWVLRMREKIEESRAAHTIAESRISNLSKAVETLSNKLDEILPKKNTQSLKDNAQETYNAKIGNSNKNDLTSSKSIPLKSVHRSTLYSLPCDILFTICNYLSFTEVFFLGQVCRAMKAAISNSFYWVKIGRSKLRCICKSSLPNKAMVEIVSYIKQKNQCLSLLRLMKDQRSIPKHRQVQPHRFSRSERYVTHALPLFEYNNNTTAHSSSARMPSSSSVLSAEQKIMSQSEILNSDFRSFAHLALESMVGLTSCLYNNQLANLLLGEGVATVMVSLLANEEGSIQNYACSVLANLLCYEAFLKKRLSSQLGNDHVFDSEDEESLQLKKKSIFPSFQDQILACDGGRQLPNLLTSPSASVNLVAKRHQQGMDYDGINVSNGDYTTNRTSSSRIQGVSNKNASRALIVLFYPDCPVHIQMNKKATGTVSVGGINVNSLKEDSSSRNSSEFTSSLPRIDDFGKSATTTSVDTKQHNIFQFPSLEAPLSPSSQGKSISSKLVQQMNMKESLNRSKDLANLHNLLVSEEIGRPWQFTYFYKSGAFKDQFATYLKFRGNEVIGMGKDNIGSFQLSGVTELDIIGHTLFFSKTYFNNRDEQSLANAMELTSLLTTNVNGYMAAEFDEVMSSHSAAANKSAAHVVHVAYWSDGIETESSTSSSSRDVNCNAGLQNMWSQGLWGVWETCSNQAHYELYKGGVFRAFPLEYT